MDKEEIAKKKRKTFRKANKFNCFEVAESSDCRSDKRSLKEMLESS